MKHKIISGQELYELVKSLTKAEKRNFQLLAGKSKSDKFYIRLFNLLNHQKEYDEQDLLKKIRLEKSKKNFSQAKKYLFEKIVESVHALGTYKNADSQIKDLIETAKLLRYKGLYRQSDRYLEMAEQEATECDTIYNHFPINYLAYNHALNSVDPVYLEDKTKELNARGKNILRRVNIYIETYHIFRMIKAIQITQPFCRSTEEQARLEEIISPLRTTDYESFPGPQSKIHYHLTMNLYHGMIGEHGESMKHCLQVIELVKANPKIDNAVFPHLGNYLTAALKACEVTKVPAALEELYSGISANPDFHEQKLIFERWLLHSLQYFNYCGSFGRSLEIHRENLPKIRAYQPFTRHIAYQILYHKAVAHFFCKEYNEAWNLISSVLNELNPRSDLFLYARIFSLLVLYERKDEFLLTYGLRSAYRLLLKKERPYQAEKIILKFIRQQSSPSQEEFRKLAESLENSFKTRYEQGILYYFDIVRWLISKV